MSDFTLDPLLAAESVPLAPLALCEARLFDDSRFPWLVLVPRKAGLVELIDLDPRERMAVTEDIAQAAEALKAVTQCYKLNVAALGNQVRQLHIHVIARFQNDAAWPQPVWGKGARVPYSDTARGEMVAKLQAALGLV
jgi:diadenosine tetraphosphate (Ap4A) HIT family hydrolase